MMASHNQNPQARTEQTNEGGESDWRYDTTTTAAWAVSEAQGGTPGAATGGVLHDPLGEELEQLHRASLYGHDATASGARSLEPSSGYDTPLGSTEVDYGSVYGNTSTRSETFWETISSLSSPGGHSPAARRTYDDCPPVPAGQALSPSNYVYLQGGVTHPGPLEIWEGARDPHESRAYRYRLVHPSAPAPAPAPVPAPTKKRKSAKSSKGGKRH